MYSVRNNFPCILVTLLLLLGYQGLLLPLVEGSGFQRIGTRVKLGQGDSNYTHDPIQVFNWFHDENMAEVFRYKKHKGKNPTSLLQTCTVNRFLLSGAAGEAQHPG